MHVLLLLFIATSFGQHAAGNEEEDNSFGEYLIQTLENFRIQMKTGNPDIGMPVLDPLRVNPISHKISESGFQVDFKVWDFVVSELSTFKVNELKVDMGSLTARADILIPLTQLTGKYDLKGAYIRLFPIYGSGNALVAIQNFRIIADIKFTLNPDPLKVQLTQLRPNLNYDQSHMDFENLLGGKSLGQVVNILLSAIGKYVFNAKKQDIEKALDQFVVKFVNKELEKFDPSKVLPQIAYAPAGPRVAAQQAVGDASEYIDQVLQMFRQNYAAQVDPLQLPNFSASVGGSVGVAAIENGQLRGLSTLFRSGQVSTSPDGLSWLSGELGVTVLEAKYNGRLKFLFVTIRPDIRAEVRNIRVSFHLNKPANSKTFQLDRFDIKFLSAPTVSISGLGALNSILGTLTNVVLPFVKGKIEDALRNPVRDLLQKQLNQLEIPII